jgi:uncharacterized protein with NAD-binding domain and iron-sulfur cluster
MRERIAILGGGVGAITTAFQLTEEPDFAERFEVTIYQLGHRLGGKGASGRGPAGRIEEHGLHVWLGFYDNAFRIIRKAYDELTPGGASQPIQDGVFSSWQHAFRKHSQVSVFDRSDAGTWEPWLIRFPEDQFTPGDARATPDLWELTVRMIEWMADAAKHGAASSLFQSEAPETRAGLAGELTRLVDELQLSVNVLASSAGLAALQALALLARSVPPRALRGGGVARDRIVQLLEALRSWIVREIGRRSPAERRLLITLDMGAAIARGLVVEGVFGGKPLRALDDDFRAWLVRQGALHETGSLATNPLLRALYDFVFAFDGGDASRLDATANFETGCAIRTIFRMLLTYRGAIFWKMNAGMGDTVFTPLYKLLKRRGVRFEFFSRVDQLRLSPDGRRIEAIEITRQATPTEAEYDPLVRVAGLDCWPATPKYALLREGRALEAQGVDLESFWSGWPGAGKLVIRRGVPDVGPDRRGFDRVVLGLSLGSVPFVCSQLMAAEPRWRDMVQHVKTVATMGVQWWLRPDLAALGWRGPSVISTAFAEPLDTWADMTHLLPREVWPGVQPGSVAYFCGALAAAEPDQAAIDTPLRALQSVGQAEATLSRDLRALWPRAFDAAGNFDQSLLVDRFRRANVDPSERYVMSVANSGKYRLRPDDSGIENLIITGDWTDNGFNAGCVEAAAMSGIQAANTICGRDLWANIVGRELL